MSRRLERVRGWILQQHRKQQAAAAATGRVTGTSAEVGVIGSETKGGRRRCEFEFWGRMLEVDGLKGLGFCSGCWLTGVRW